MEGDRRSSIASALCPRVAVFSTPDVDEACRRNGVADLAGLLRPFSAVERVSVRTSSFATLNLPALHLSFFPSSDLTSSQADDAVALDQAASSVFQPKRVERWLSELPERRRRVRRRGTLKFENEWIEEEPDDKGEGPSGRPGMDEEAPWYAALREQLLLSQNHRPLAPFDSTSHPVACVIAVSTSNPEPLNGFAQLYDSSSRDGSGWRGAGEGLKERSWMDCGGPGVLRYYVVVHEGADETGRKDALELLDSVKRSYGIHCAILCINSLHDPAANAIPTPFPGPPSLAPLDGTSPPTPAPAPTQDPQLRQQIAAYWQSAADHRPPQNGYVVGAGDGKPPPTPEHGAAMNETDVRMLRLFLREFTVQSLVPHMERSVQQWNESLTSSRPAITGRIFSAGRKYFGGSGSSSRVSSPLSISAGGNATGYNAAKAFYPHQSSEAQTRRLADFAFMLHDYRFAAQTYDLVRKDFAQDKAWRYYASATRMTGLCNLMLMPASAGKLPVEVDPFLEQAASVVAPGQMSLDSLRMIVMYLEAYRAIGDVESAARGLLRAAGGLDEVLSAALLEQAAIAQLQLSSASPQRVRKFAVHMVAAAHRYEVGGQRALSRHCLGAASSIYASTDPSFPLSARGLGIADKGEGWRFVRQHVVHMQGRQAFNAGQVEAAVRAFWKLVCSAAAEDDSLAGDESESLHEGFLGDFTQAFTTFKASKDPTTILDVAEMKPLFDPAEARIRIAHHDAPPPADEIEATVWRGLEDDFFEGLGSEVAKPPPLNVARSDNVALIDETFHLELTARNPLNATLRITDLRADIRPRKEGADLSSVILEPVQDFDLGPKEVRKIFIAIRCHAEVEIEFSGVRYSFHGLLPRSEPLIRRGPRLHATKEHRLTATYGAEIALRVRIRSAIPLVSVVFEGLVDDALEGETSVATMTVTNAGKVALKNLAVVLSHPSFFHITADPAPVYTATTHARQETAQISNAILPNAPIPIPLDGSSNGVLDVGASCSVPIVCHGDIVGAHLTCWLFVYQSAITGEYVHSRITHPLEVWSALEISATTRASASSPSAYLLSLHMLNSGVPDPVEITQISTAGRHWRTETLLEPSEAVVLDPQQVGVVALKASPIVDDGSDDAGFIVPQLELLLRGGQDIKGRTPPLTNLTLSSSALVTPARSAFEARFVHLLSTSRRRAQHEQLALAFPSISPSSRRHLFPLYSQRALDVVVFWRIPALGREGHCVTRVLLGAPQDLVGKTLDTAAEKAGGIYAESQRERRVLVAEWRRSEFGRGEDPLALQVGAEEQLDHDFATDGPLSLRVPFALRNLASFSISYSLVLQRRPSAAWVGPLLFTGTLGPHASTTVVATAWRTEPGPLDVGAYAAHVVAGGSSVAWWQDGRRAVVNVNDSSASSRYPPPHGYPRVQSTAPA